MSDCICQGTHRVELLRGQRLLEKAKAPYNGKSLVEHLRDLLADVSSRYADPKPSGAETQAYLYDLCRFDGRAVKLFELLLEAVSESEGS